MRQVQTRLCYENGVEVPGKKIYEFHQLCHCPECVARAKKIRGSWNTVTATTKDQAKIPEILEFLGRWTCPDGEKELPTIYLEF